MVMDDQRGNKLRNRCTLMLIPNTAAIGAREIGVKLDARGYIRVSERLETTEPDVGPLETCAGSPQFTHVAGDGYRIIRDSLARQQRSTRDRRAPCCVFTDPPIAHGTPSECNAQRNAIAVRVAKLPMSAVLRTEARGETKGLLVCSMRKGV